MPLSRAPGSTLPRLLLLLLPLGCTVDLSLPEGLACDAERPCLEGRVCGGDGRCRAPTDGGAVPPDGGTQGPVNVGVRWEQASGGFEDVDACASGCGATIEREQGHLLTVQLPAGAGAFAHAFPADELLPGGASGRLRGRLLVPASVRFEGSAVLLDIESEDGPSMLRLLVGAQGALGVASGASTLSSEALSVPDTGARLLAGTTHVVEVAYQQGAFVRLWLDGQPVLDRPLAPYSNDRVSPKDLWLGLEAVGAPAAGLELGFRDWKYSSVADTVLTD